MYVSHLREEFHFMATDTNSPPAPMTDNNITLPFYGLTDIQSDAICRIIRLLELSAYKIWDAVLTGNQCPKIREIFDDMQNPRPGDLVIESSTIYGAKMSGKKGKLKSRGICGIGYLVKIVREPIWTLDQWTESGEDEDVPIPTEKVIYIQLFDGREMRWTNANILKVPVNLLEI